MSARILGKVPWRENPHLALRQHCRRYHSKGHHLLPHLLNCGQITQAIRFRVSAPKPSEKATRARPTPTTFLVYNVSDFQKRPPTAKFGHLHERNYTDISEQRQENATVHTVSQHTHTPSPTLKLTPCDEASELARHEQHTQTRARRHMGSQQRRIQERNTSPPSLPHPSFPHKTDALTSTPALPITWHN